MTVERRNHVLKSLYSVTRFSLLALQDRRADISKWMSDEGTECNIATFRRLTDHAQGPTSRNDLPG
jgi:hypothetical protein